MHKSIREVAVEYFGKQAFGWDRSLEKLGDRLDQEGITYYEYFAYLLNAYADNAHRRGTRNSEKVFRRYPEYRQTQERLAELNSSLDKRTFEAHLALGESPREILTDDKVELSPLFKYTMAMTLGLYSLAPDFQKEAAKQLKENTAYFTSYSKFRHVLPVKREDI